MEEQVTKFVTLNPELIQHIEQAFVKVQPMDIDIDYFRKLKKEIGEDGIIDHSRYDELGGKFLWLLDVCENNARVCEAFALEAKRRLDAETSLAFLDRSTKYLANTMPPKITSKGETVLNITDGQREKYIDLDQNVQKLKLLYNSWNILSKFFLDLSNSNEKKHDWIKKLIERDIRSKSMMSGQGGEQ